MTTLPHQPYFPGRPPVEAYGNGGFRFADMSHQGSLLFLPTGVYGWQITEAKQLTLADLQPALNEADDIQLLLLGTGPRQDFPDGAILKAFSDARIGLDIMDTGAAARTYNVLLAEGRQVAAALICVA